MPKIFAISIALFLLLGAGYGLSQATRSIPWDCSDWQPYTHADRTTAILESLAENRGKTLYCGIDQSDTFSKAETWQAGKDRNERDDTIYWGERGSFRGFIAAQEGWLTDGESGITGQSIATIFEFPREQRRGWKNKRITVPPSLERKVRTGLGQPGGSFNNRLQAEQGAQNRFSNPIGSGTAVPYNWLTLSEPAAQAACRARGSKFLGVTPSPDNSGGWEYGENIDSGNWHQYGAIKTNTWTAVCKKRVRRTR